MPDNARPDGLKDTTPVFVAYWRSADVYHLYWRVESEGGYGYLPACRPFGMLTYCESVGRVEAKGFRACKRCMGKLKREGPDNFWI